MRYTEKAGLKLDYRGPQMSGWEICISSTQRLFIDLFVLNRGDGQRDFLVLF